MTPIPAPPELLATARRVVWFKPPEDALRDPIFFLNHLMVWGTLEDLRVRWITTRKTTSAVHWRSRFPGCSTRAPGPTGTSG